MDRRRHRRYLAHGRAEVLVLRDVDVESASPGALTVLAAAPAAAGMEAALRVRRSEKAQVTLRVRATHCHPVFADGYRRFRVTYAVLGPEDRLVP